MATKNNLSQPQENRNTLPASGQPFSQAQSLRSFYYHLDKLNKLARLAKEAPINSDQAEQFCQVFLEGVTSVGQLERLAWSRHFERAIRSLVSDPAAWETAEQKLLAGER